MNIARTLYFMWILSDVIENVVYQNQQLQGVMNIVGMCVYLLLKYIVLCVLPVIKIIFTLLAVPVEVPRFIHTTKIKYIYNIIFILRMR